VGLLAFAAPRAGIMSTPDVLKALQSIRLKMQSGKTVSRSIDLAVIEGKNPFAQALRVWKARIDLGQEALEIVRAIPDLKKTAGRRALMIVLEKGLKGAPIDEYLAELEKEFYRLAEYSYDKHLQTLPLKMMVPLMLLILPGVMLLLIGPLLFSVGRGF
jgi:pilus assembly protein TadC